MARDTIKDSRGIKRSVKKNTRKFRKIVFAYTLKNETFPLVTINGRWLSVVCTKGPRVEYNAVYIYVAHIIL